ncbi:MAG TPA: SDR family oxidoreductase [Gemmatimonadaceae bacterium]|nr:SDR family oxidoreductase [Gemmatimonadaceae bacterium]
MQFDDRVVVLTGVGREGQVGEVVARAFAERGARVVVVDRDQQVEARAAALRDAGFPAVSMVCDLTDETQVARLAHDVAAELDGRVHALVNLAGGFAMSGPVAESRLDEWQRQFTINLTTAYLATRAFLPALRKGAGSIVYFSSASALPSARTAKTSAYAAAKSGVIALMRAVAEEEHHNGVRANAVAPTSIRTASNVDSMGTKVRYVEREQVADAVLFLCSPQASAITGQVVELK